jgi:hypothetical protein
MKNAGPFGCSEKLFHEVDDVRNETGAIRGLNAELFHPLNRRHWQKSPQSIVTFTPNSALQSVTKLTSPKVMFEVAAVDFCDK